MQKNPPSNLSDLENIHLASYPQDGLLKESTQDVMIFVNLLLQMHFSD